MLSKIILTLTIVGLSIVIVMFINFSIIYKIQIPDPCAYDVDAIKTSKLFDLFYEISSNTGYNAEPSKFNVYFTIIVGLCLGIIATYKLIWKRKLTINTAIETLNN